MTRIAPSSSKAKDSVPAHPASNGAFGGSTLRSPRAVATIGLYTLAFFVALPLALWRLGSNIDEWLALPSLDLGVTRPLGALIALCSATLMLHAMWVLWREGRGLPISHLPPSALVQRGVFGRLRHPIYVGYTLCLAGVGLFFASVGRGVLMPMLLTLAWIAYAAGLEEPALERRFGSAYARYRAQTSCLPIPFGAAVDRLGLSAWHRARPCVERLATRQVLFRIGSSVWVSNGAFQAVGASIAAALLIGLLADHADALRADWLLLPGPGLDPWWVLDRIVAAGFASSALGEISCLTLEQGDSGVLRRVPIQLLASAWAALLCGLALTIGAHGAPPGVTAVLSVLVFAIGRFGIDAPRDADRVLDRRFSRGQLVAGTLSSAALAITLLEPLGFARGQPDAFSFDPAEPLRHAGTLALAATLVFAACGHQRTEAARQ